MCNQSVIKQNSRKLYLASFEFISGEYEQSFDKAFYAENEEDLENIIHEFLVNYYGASNLSEIDRNIYFYWKYEVAVKQRGWQEIKDFEQLVDRLL